MIAEWANKYIGIPYELNGRDKNKCDCYGLVRLIYKEVFGINLPSYSNEYTIESKNKDLTEIYNDNKVDWIEVTVPQAGDVVYLVIGGYPKHVGVVVGDKLFIHNLCLGGSSSLADYSSKKWKQRVIGFYRYAPSTS